MKTVLLSLLAATPLLAQDPVAARPEQNKVLIDNERVRVFETRLAPGESSPLHSHPAFVAYSLCDAEVRFTLADGTIRELTLKPGLAAWNPPLTHSIDNTGNTEFRVLHVELKEASPHAAQSHLFNEADLKWTDAPASLPEGCKIAILEGNPKEPGPFTMRVKFPAGTRLQPHSHAGDERVTVISGLFRIGHGEVFDEKQTTEIRRGGFTLMPAGSPHFAFFPEETILQLHGEGPWKIIYLQPRKAPGAEGSPSR